MDAFKLWCWRRLLRVPWTARRSNQSILKEINPEYSLEALKLKLQYFGHLMWREKDLMVGKIEGNRRRGWHRMRWLDSITDSMDLNLSELQETMKDRRPWCAAVRGVEKRQTWLSNWTTTTTDIYSESKHEKKKGISWILPLPSLPTAVYFIQFIQFSTQSIILNHITSQPKLLLKRLLSLWLLF